MDAFEAESAAWRFNSLSRDMQADSQRLALDVAGGNLSDLRRAAVTLGKQLAAAERVLSEFTAALGDAPPAGPRTADAHV